MAHSDEPPGETTKKTYHARGGFAAARGWNVPRIIRRGPQFGAALEGVWSPGDSGK